MASQRQGAPPRARDGRRGAIRFLADRSGAYAVEFALVVPILLTLLFGSIEVARGIFVQGMLDYAVEQAARCASIDSTNCGSASAIASFASAQTSPLNIPATDFTATAPACGNLVSASYTFSFVGTFALIGGTAIFPSSITLTSSSCYPS